MSDKFLEYFPAAWVTFRSLLASASQAIACGRRPNCSRLGSNFYDHILSFSLSRELLLGKLPCRLITNDKKFVDLAKEAGCGELISDWKSYEGFLDA